MAGRYYTHETIFQQPWEQVVQSLWKRYPNPYSTHVLTEDTLIRRTEGHRLISKRILTKTNPLPKWTERVIGRTKIAMFVEESIVDAKAKTFVIYKRNVTQAKLLSMIEKSTYCVSPTNPKLTCCLKQVWIQCGMYGISRFVEKFGLERYKVNSKRAELGLQIVIDKMFNTANQVVQQVLAKK